MRTRHDKAESSSAGGLSRFLSVADALGKSSACIAVMGYMSARWHWNVLGISMIKPLSLPTYLMETLYFVVQTVFDVAPWLIVILIARIIGGLVLKPFGVSPSRLLPPWSFHSVPIVWTVVALSSILALVLIQLQSVHGDLLVGPMDKDADHRIAEYRWLQNVVDTIYPLLWLFLLVLGLLLAKQRAIPFSGTASPVWRIARFPVIIGFRHIPSFSWRLMQLCLSIWASGPPGSMRTESGRVKLPVARLVMAVSGTLTIEP
jgi:hypothetical protein